MEITNIQKRNGDIAAFDIQKIVTAIFNSMRESDAGSRDDAARIAELVHQQLLERAEMIPKHRRGTRYR